MVGTWHIWKMKGSFKNIVRKMTYFSLSLSLSAGSHHQMMLDMAQFQSKQPFLGLSMAVYEYTTSALYPLSSLDGRVFFWFHSIVYVLLCGITSSPPPIGNPYFQTNICQRLLCTRLIFFSTIVSVYKCILQKGRTIGASYLTPSSYPHWLWV